MDSNFWINIMQWLSWFLLGTGCFFILTGVIGILRLPDIYTRLHAASLTDTLGLEFMLIGLMINAGWSMVTIKLGLIGLFILISGPTAVHALANTAYITNIKHKEGNDF